jgi:hypothetical protein
MVAALCMVVRDAARHRYSARGGAEGARVVLSPLSPATSLESRIPSSSSTTRWHGPLGNWGTTERAPVNRALTARAQARRATQAVLDNRRRMRRGGGLSPPSTGTSCSIPTATTRSTTSSTGSC